MKNKMMKKMNRKMRKAKMKSSVIMEMAEDLKDLWKCYYIKLKVKDKYQIVYKNNLNIYVEIIFILFKQFLFLFRLALK